ncbi:MAG: shikimate kinase [Gammaproteobacteria bacterium]|nr:MAG: shikimate kinase [Gammaproteobacteria bacterium]
MTDLSTLPSTINLIGMPGAGKSTIGVLLAKQSGHRFVDTDIDIQARTGTTLQDILEERGFQALRDVEEEVLLSVDIDNAIVSTGGSVVYSDASMQRLRRAGPVVYLNVPLTVLQERVDNAPPRGIASDTAQTFAEVFAERTPLYQRYADITINTQGLSPDAIANRIFALVSKLQQDSPKKSEK